MKYKKWSDTELSYIKHHSADIPDKYIEQILPFFMVFDSV